MSFDIDGSLIEGWPFKGSKRDEQMGAIGILWKSQLLLLYTWLPPDPVWRPLWTSNKTKETKSRTTKLEWRSARRRCKTSQVRYPKLLAYKISMDEWPEQWGKTSSQSSNPSKTNGWLTFPHSKSDLEVNRKTKATIQLWRTNFTLMRQGVLSSV